MYWLKANNPLYADVTLDFRYLEDWAREEVVVHDIIEDPSLPKTLQSQKSDDEENNDLYFWESQGEDDYDEFPSVRQSSIVDLT